MVSLLLLLEKCMYMSYGKSCDSHFYIRFYITYLIMGANIDGTTFIYKFFYAKMNGLLQFIQKSK
jgi:hypothetical protein